MSTDDKMTVDERRKYLRRMKPHYVAANRAERSRLLDDMVQMTELDRKTIIRLMGSDLKRKPRQRQRGCAYGPEVDDALRVIAETLDYICAERMTPQLVVTAQQLARHGELHLTADLLGALARVSVATIRRYLQRLRQDEPCPPPKKGGAACKPLSDIPMTGIPWAQAGAGHFEVDLVHHCGPTTAGECVHTLQMVDVATGWSERVAILGLSVLDLSIVSPAYPSPFAKFIPTMAPNSSMTTCSASSGRSTRRSSSPAADPTAPMTTAVSSKKSSLIRAYPGDVRLDTVQHTRVLNQLYGLMWLYYNFFQPVMRSRDKASSAMPRGPHGSNAATTNP